MGFTNKKYTYDELCKINSSGFNHALLPQVIDALNTRFKEIYGNDIDVSSASADGQLIMSEAYILENIYMVLDDLYKNLNPNLATGSHLDILASFSNILRKQPTKSTAQIYVKKVNASVDTTFTGTIYVQDVNGNIWSAVSNTTSSNFNKVFSSTNNYTLLLDFECDDYGAVTAVGTGAAVPSSITAIFDTSGGYYYNATTHLKNDNTGSFISIDSNYLVYQLSDAKKGQTAESDESLRSRIRKEKGLGATTTLDSLTAALYDLDYIKDAKVFNNPTSPLSDGTTFTSDAGSVYIAIRYVENAVWSNYAKQVGELIWNYMTPGIKTIPVVSGTTQAGTSGSYNVVGEKGNMTFYWKVCTAITPGIEINYSLNQLAAGGLTAENKASIEESIRYYIENVGINEELSATKIMNAVMTGDLKDNGNSIIFPTSCTITNGTNKISYFNCGTFDWTTSGKIIIS